MKKTWKLTSQGPPKWLPKSMKIDPWSSQGSPGTPKRLKDAPMPPKRSPRDQKCLPKSSKTAPKINKKRYLQLPESLDPSQNHIISNCRKSPYENWWRVASGTVITIVFSKSEQPKSPQKQHLWELVAGAFVRRNRSLFWYIHIYIISSTVQI